MRGYAYERRKQRRSLSKEKLCDGKAQPFRTSGGIAARQLLVAFVPDVELTLSYNLSLYSTARGGLVLDAFVSHVAGEMFGQVEFVVNDVFHVDACGACVLEENL